MDRLNITNLARGAVVEQFDFELQNVLENILDPNTNPEKARKIQINVTIKPSKNRAMANIQVQTKSTLIPAAPLETAIIMERDIHGHVVAEEFGTGQIPGQVDMSALLESNENSEKVVNINSK